MNEADTLVLKYVNKEINKGKTVIYVPVKMFSAMSADGLEALKDLTLVNNVKVIAQK